MVLAEAVSIDGRLVLLVLLVLLLLGASLVVLVVGGFVLARRAGRESRSALQRWRVLLALEIAPFVLVDVLGFYRRLGIVRQLGPGRGLLAAVAGAQVLMYLLTRSRAQDGAHVGEGTP